MKEGGHGAVFPNVPAERCVPGLEQPPVELPRHERASIHAQVVAESDNVRHVPDRAAHILQQGQVPFQESVEQPFDVRLLQEQVHEEIVQSSEKTAPFEKVAARDDDHGAVRLGAERERPLAEDVPEIRVGRIVPG